MIDVILKRFETPDETRQLIKGRFEIVRLGGMTVAKGFGGREHADVKQVADALAVLL